MEPKEVTITCRVEESLRDDLRELAALSGRKFSEEVRRALRLYILETRLSGERVKV